MRGKRFGEPWEEGLKRYRRDWIARKMALASFLCFRVGTAVFVYKMCVIRHLKCIVEMCTVRD